MAVCLPQTCLVHIIDDDQDFRRSLAWTLRSVNYEVQTHASAKEFLSALDPKLPCCALVDLLLPGMTGLKLCQELIVMKASCSFVVISGHGDLPSVVELMKMGAVDFLEKPCSRQTLLDAVYRATDFAIRRHQEILEQEAAMERLSTLSPREQEVFDKLAAGLVTKQIASQLGISPKTVDVHRSKIMQKLDIQSPTELAYLVYLRLRRERQGSWN